MRNVLQNVSETFSSPTKQSKKLIFIIKLHVCPLQICNFCYMHIILTHTVFRSHYQTLNSLNLSRENSRKYVDPYKEQIRFIYRNIVHTLGLSPQLFNTFFIVVQARYEFLIIFIT